MGSKVFPSLPCSRAGTHGWVWTTVDGRMFSTPRLILNVSRMITGKEGSRVPLMAQAGQGASSPLGNAERNTAEKAVVQHKHYL